MRTCFAPVKSRRPDFAYLEHQRRMSKRAGLLALQSTRWLRSDARAHDAPRLFVAASFCAAAITKVLYSRHSPPPHLCPPRYVSNPNPNPNLILLLISSPVSSRLMNLALYRLSRLAPLPAATSNPAPLLADALPRPSARRPRLPFSSL